MSLLELWVHTPAAAALGWTLAHSLWQGALVALVLAAALGVMRSSRARYAAACVAMLALLCGFCVTFQHVLAEQGMQGAGPSLLKPAPADLGDGPIAAKVPARFRAVEYLPWLAPFWMAGVLFFQLRGVASWMAARRMRRRGVCAATGFWQGRLDTSGARLRVSRPVTLLESCLAEVPVVIGYLRPVILMPVGLLAGLPPSQVESILLHELAHIRRHDYLVNLLQIVVESLVFYHPAVWWISGVIRAERENCCDDVVVATQGDRFVYAAALAALEENRGVARDAVLAATGGSLVKRVRRLLVQPEGPRATLTPVLSAAVLTMTLAAAMAAWQTSATPPRPPAPPAPPAPSVPVRVLAQAQSAPAPVAEATPYTKWVSEDVAYIITDAERAAFKRLQSNAEREHFIEQFWLRRDPTPGTVENEFKEEHYRRIAYANDHYASGIPGWKTDRGRIYITYGPPDEKESHPSGSATSDVPSEQWLYSLIQGVGTNIIVEFVDSAKTGEYRMTMDPSVMAVVTADTPKAGATVQPMIPGGVLISVPLTAYGDHKVSVSARVVGREGRVAHVSEDPIQGPAPIFTKVLPLAKGTYRFEIVVRDMTSGKLAADNIEFEVK
ncbi:MAG: GWxTD domain-containing protein [Candidatus Solibacter sp.]|jgi:GWxTD domain-containing protein